MPRFSFLRLSFFLSPPLRLGVLVPIELHLHSSTPCLLFFLLPACLSLSSCVYPPTCPSPILPSVLVVLASSICASVLRQCLRPCICPSTCFSTPEDLPFHVCLQVLFRSCGVCLYCWLAGWLAGCLVLGCPSACLFVYLRVFPSVFLS